MNRRLRVLQSPKIAEKKRKRILITTFLLFFCVILFLISTVFFFRLPFLRITNIEFGGVKTLNTKEIESKVFENLNGYYLYFIPKSNILFFPKSAIKENLSKLYKKIDKIDVHRRGTKTIGIDISEKIPVALVCRGFQEEVTMDDKYCYFVDSNAFVFEQAPQFSNGVYIKYYIISDLTDNIIGTNFIDIDLFNSLQNMVDTAYKAQINPVGILIGLQGDYEMYIKNKDESLTTVFFDNRSPFKKTISNLIVFIADSNLKKKTATSTSFFDYINLRFGNNIFYVPKQL
jgi:hypothetical protein